MCVRVCASWRRRLNVESPTAKSPPGCSGVILRAFDALPKFWLFSGSVLGLFVMLWGEGGDGGLVGGWVGGCDGKRSPESVRYVLSRAPRLRVWVAGSMLFWCPRFRPPFGPPKWPQGAPKSPPRRPETPQRRFQDGPKNLQEAFLGDLGRSMGRHLFI